ncbi:MAG TPA: cell wall anchor protein, partial [Paraburkholderia sp.]|nr:cell wall anchor protein [Paraburkholderia sp.]
MSNKIRTGMTRLALCAAMTFALAACGGGGGSSPAQSSTSNPQPSTQAASALTGTVAVGDALPGANITLLDATGKRATATSDSNGNYSISITGLTAPFLIVATDPSGVNATMYSVLA